MGTILGPKYIPYSYTEPLGMGSTSSEGVIATKLQVNGATAVP